VDFTKIANNPAFPLQRLLRYSSDANPNEITIQQLYPNLTEEELAEAEKNLTAYLSIVARIFDRLQKERGASADSIGTLSCTPPASGSSENSPPK
jgi:hypothetical protein